MAYLELLKRVLGGMSCCEDYTRPCPYDCPYYAMSKFCDESGKLRCIAEFERDQKHLTKIMEYLDKIQEEVWDNGRM